MRPPPPEEPENESIGRELTRWDEFVLVLAAIGIVAGPMLVALAGAIRDAR